MFHLTLIKMLWREHFSKMMLVIGVLAVFSYGVSHQDLLRKEISQKFGVGEQVEGPFFYAIIQNMSVAENLRIKLLELPGIERVTIITPEALNQKMDTFFENVSKDPELKNKMSSIVKEQIGIRVIFKNDVDNRSTTLISNYLKRLTEGTETSIGPLIDKRKQMMASPWLNPMLVNLDIILLIITLPIIMLVLIVMSGQFRNTLYIYNRYQRRKVNPLTFSLILCLFLVLPFYFIPLINSNDLLRSMGLCLAIFLLMFLQVARNPNWRMR